VIVVDVQKGMVNLKHMMVAGEKYEDELPGLGG